MPEPLNILVVDDDPDTCRTLSDILELKGHSPHTAASAEDALKQLADNDFAVVLIDLRLPDLPGTTVLQRVKSMSPDTEAMVITGHASVGTAIEAVEYGAFAYLEKPVDPAQVLAVIQRAAEKRQLAIENRRLIDELQQFGYVVSHDLQAPLRTMSGFAQLLNKFYKGKLDERADGFIQEIINGTADMKRLVDDLLQFSRVRRAEEPPEPADCSAALDEALANLRAAIEESGAVVERGGLPTMPANHSQLVQLFQNLVSNAIKYRSDEPPKVEVKAERQVHEWRFSVCDNGIGIDPEHLDRIFMIFQRLHTLDEYSGTGIGLAICKKIVELHGGRTWAESEPGKGSTFYFTIPETGATERLKD